MITVIYYIKGEEDKTLSIVKAKTLKDFTEKFINIEEIDIFGDHENNTIKQLLQTGGFDKWEFIMTDDKNIEGIKLVIDNM